MTRNYVIGIIILLAIIIVGWMISFFGTEKYIAVDMATTTGSKFNNLGTTTGNGTNIDGIKTATTTINN